MEYNEELLTPLDYYNKTLKDKFLETIEQYIDDLKNESKIDLEHNKVEVEKYKKCVEIENKIRRVYNFYSVIEILGIISSIILAIVAYNNLEKRYLYIVACLITIIFSIWMHKKSNLKKELLDDAVEKSKNQLKICYDSMESLNNLLCSETTHDLIRKSIPFIHIDRNFDKKRFEQLKFDYGFSDNNNLNASSTELISGDILGNPFVFIGSINHRIVNHTYTGSRTVFYTEYYTDSDGKTRSRTVSETLYASVVKPKPDYYEDVCLVYACDAAPRLSFSRRPSEKNNSFSIFNRNPNLKALKKKMKESTTFVPMTDEEFDAQFGALNRNNETEFRLLFTPLAIENMKKLMNNSLYGDDFYFTKSNKINYIEAYHTREWYLNTNRNKVRHYDFEYFKKYFIEINADYFEHFYYMMLPLLSIPIYQQYKSKEYIYGNILKYNYNGYLTETLANEMSEQYFAHPLTKTRTILKTEVQSSSADIDLVKVKAYSYNTIQRLTYIPIMAGNGMYYDVPVYWDEYISLYNERYMKVIDSKLKEREHKKLFKDNNKLSEELENYSKYCYKNDMMAFLSK